MSLVRTIFSLALVILVLVSSTSFMVGVHVCMGEVQEVALFRHADGCEKEQALPPCHKHMKPACCEDEVIVHEASDLKASSEQLQFYSPLAFELALPFSAIAEIIPSSQRSITFFSYYDPPLPPVDFTVKHRVFLI